MGIFSRGKTRYSSVSNLSSHLWHFDGGKTYEDCDEAPCRAGGKPGGRDRLSHYMAAGGLKYESRPPAREQEPAARRALVKRWLAVLALLWVVFRFVRP